MNDTWSRGSSHMLIQFYEGGAGTTAAGLRAGKPTVIVPFFGDQFFWGRSVEKMGLGPHPIPYPTLTSKAFPPQLKIES